MEATRLIRSMDREDARSIPVFAMTGNVFKDDIEQYREARMDGHIIKPVDFVELIHKLSVYHKK